MILKTQFELLMYSFLIGFYLGVTYDLFFYFIFMHLNKILKFIFDLIFFVCQGFIIFHLIYGINHGIIPLYCYIFFGLGFFIYYSYSQRYYQNSIYPLRKVVYAILSKLVKILKYIFVKPFIDTSLFLYNIYQYFARIIGNYIKSVGKKIKKRKNAKKTKISNG